MKRNIELRKEAEQDIVAPRV
ncbi:hypothetical protein SCOCK_490005 [Actinacidiphila cocklensis]|uniref:Uncharacterized protein n=1 Tax=Actinacidiphila cocklensis TaxID=887465 RepID=A0A9W4GVN2_9ACTN|nr:hypothetical protein SCOCK_490005 [Actinacidiphila cocklensis]